MTIKPIVPKISRHLEPWDGVIEADTQLSDSSVTGGDFSQVSRLSIDGSIVQGSSATAVTFDIFEITDTTIAKFDGAGMRTYKANLLRVKIDDSRLTGAEFAEAQLEDCTFSNVKFDEIGFRFASFKRVVFENCVFRNADFSNARMQQVRFTGCDMEAANFGSATCINVDITEIDLSVVKGILGLKGATISPVQLIQIAPLLAVELGFQIEGTS